MKKALIIFVRKPERGKVKTRLAASLGDEAALLIYKKLLQHTLEITSPVDADKGVFYAGEIEENDMWQSERYFKQQQAGGDLGDRMNAAFETVFRMGYHQVCIIGSDCYQLTPEIIADAFQALEKNDLVIGPAYDGGYYLLGMKQLHSSLFQNKQWSTGSVCADTLLTAAHQKLTVAKLSTLHDVDEADDVPGDWLNELKR
ncbi:MAG TPA: TIGR04282 family arsenosugar biosynthesis glycosyltransferase [Flavisolibacter sp.]|nr:TIGR04282 family arsenosugar biosynthesis glycosyltransferase [Flavisolibacter sp.]